MIEYFKILYPRKNISSIHVDSIKQWIIDRYINIFNDGIVESISIFPEPYVINIHISDVCEHMDMIINDINRFYDNMKFMNELRLSNLTGEISTIVNDVDIFDVILSINNTSFTGIDLSVYHIAQILETK